MRPLHKKEQEIIDNILNEFDFEKCHRVMEFLNWTWSYNPSPPSIHELRSSAKDRFNNAIEGILTAKDHSHHHRYSCSSGGLKPNVWKNKYNQICDAELEFVLTDWSSR